jgi:starch-binding outer membrane protein, SusD/RagB family
MKSKIKYIFLVMLLSLQFSCNNWIELLPPTGLIREEYWKSKEDVESVMMGAYQSFAALDGTLFQFGEMRADMVSYGVNLGGDQRNIMDGNIYPENGMASWSSFYKIINYANEVIKNAPLVQEIDESYTDYQLQGILSEAYFIRNLAYFYLVRIFKDVPYIVEPSENDAANFYFPKSDGDEILKTALKELIANRDFAIADYRTLEETKGRATKAAFDALIADIALWLFDYETCIKYTDNILANEKYVLLPNVRWFEIFYPGNSLEGIFEFQLDQSKSQSNATFGLTNYNQNRANYVPSPKTYPMFAFDYESKEMYRGEQATIKKYGEDNYIIWKYVGRAPDGSSLRTGTETSSCNWIVYRYADIMLMKAEALSQLERYSEALQLINDIRERADVTPVVIANSKTAFEDAILNERALELAYEGKRWFDLLRMGRRNNYARKSDLISLIIQKVPSTQKRILATKLTNPLGWYMPISKSEIERNPALVQNPFYKY